MDSFPAYFPLAGRKVVIAGSGEAADNKARLFDGSPATLVRVDGHAAFLPGTYAGAVLAFVAGDDEVFLQAAASAARAARVLVNVVDKPAMSDFNTPAVIDRGEVVAAVGTGGGSPTLATKLRNDIEAQVPEGSGRVAALLRKFQDEVRGALPALHERRAFLRDAVAGEAAQAAMAGDMEKAGQLFRQALARGVGREGKVRFIAGKGPSDLLTLRALRALGAADVLIADEGADPEIVTMARRDVHRLDPAQVAAETLVTLAKEGKQIVRLIVAPVDPAIVQALAAASVAVEVLMAAPAG
ncbi:NAD(P)-dependent oxidoreductase [Caulobacter sp. UNC279MFTsu5.1]|uniref:NAD(P)-dependent oxidoreductase n=1 Tax=Caulobacter sp. UNC279MFTsu5.1 TaxID=1502775 RepID=UPI0008F03C16|nr:NAD(P)-dependent oxidoreductase [Caulobacter sp. UNC279MFTsu5.1]SFK09315.1 precorrin-2 dehydrogenase / sirohydrochlorin ferrochelatase [Caulobacter sp. UNC279MFTsu5.1]